LERKKRSGGAQNLTKRQWAKKDSRGTVHQCVREWGHRLEKHNKARHSGSLGRKKELIRGGTRITDKAFLGGKSKVPLKAGGIVRWLYNQRGCEEVQGAMAKLGAQY